MGKGGEDGVEIDVAAAGFDVDAVEHGLAVGPGAGAALGGDVGAVFDVHAGDPVAVAAHHLRGVHARPRHVADVRAEVEQVGADVVEDVADLALGLDPGAHVRVQCSNSRETSSRATRRIMSVSSSRRCWSKPAPRAGCASRMRPSSGVIGAEMNTVFWPRARWTLAVSRAAFRFDSSEKPWSDKADLHVARRRLQAVPAQRLEERLRRHVARDVGVEGVEAGRRDQPQDLLERRQQRRVDQAVGRRHPLNLVQRDLPLAARGRLGTRPDRGTQAGGTGKRTGDAETGGGAEQAASADASLDIRDYRHVDSLLTRVPESIPEPIPVRYAAVASSSSAPAVSQR